MPDSSSAGLLENSVSGDAMNNANDDFRTALDAIAAGKLDAMTPEQVARLETQIDQAPELADRLAGIKPAVEPGFRLAVEPPPEDVWERVWQRVNAAASSTRRHVWRLWRPLAVAAACVLMVGLWNARGPALQEGPVEWARDVEIDDLEVFDGATPFVLAAGADSPVSVIWLLDEES